MVIHNCETVRVARRRPAHSSIPPRSRVPRANPAELDAL